MVFDQKYQKPRENKKKTKLQTLTHQLVPTWVLQFCFFCFLLGFLEVFLVFDQKYQKPRENKKKQNCRP